MMICLHGFLGLPSDWDPFRGKWRDAAGGEVSLTTPRLDAASGSLTGWARRFCDTAGRTERPAWLMGYSMGARLAMHALCRAPSLWQGAILISAHPGLQAASERAERLISDERWAARFESESWNEVVEAWNRQPVFQGRPPAFPRLEESFSRALLSLALRRWSLGRQDSLWERLGATGKPTLWIAGKQDSKFLSLARRAAGLPGARCAELRGAAHRGPWESPEELIGLIQSFLDEKGGTNVANG